MSDLEGRTVLVVEDLFYLAMDVKTALAKAGAAVVGPYPTAAAALAGLAALGEGRRPHCAVLDVNLGEGASFDVARTLRRDGVPFIFFTGYDARGIPEEFAAVGRLEKPVEPARLVAAVLECFAKHPGRSDAG